MMDAPINSFGLRILAYKYHIAGCTTIISPAASFMASPFSDFIFAPNHDSRSRATNTFHEDSIVLLPRGESHELLLKPEHFDQLTEHPIAQVMKPLNVSRRFPLYSIR